MVRLVLLCAAASLGILISAGCPSLPPPPPGDMTPSVSASVLANVGEDVTLTAHLLNIDDPNSVTFQWYPPEGWTVELEDANTPSASFVVPPVTTDERLEFRVEVTTPDGTTYSDTVEAMAAPSSGLVISAGWPPETGDPGDPGDATPGVRASGAPNVEQEVDMTAELPLGADLTGITYRWYQTYGRSVDIKVDDPNAPNASFEAPSLGVTQALTFRIDVTAPDETIYSDTVAVTVAADPDYRPPSSPQWDEDEPYPQVRLVTSMGSITVELDGEHAKLTVNNFLRYVDDGFYDGTIFHRVIADFVVQGGGYDEDLELLDTRPPILNEADNGLSNVRGTLGLAYSPDEGPDSGASQFYINVMDNLHLDYDNPHTDAADDGNKNTVFGKVIDGMDIVDAIAEVRTGTRSGMQDVPVENVFLRRVERIESDDDTDGGDGADGGDRADGGDGPITDIN